MKLILIIVLNLFLFSCDRLSINDRSIGQNNISISLILVYPQNLQKGVITYLHSKNNFGTPPKFVDSVLLSVNNVKFDNIPSDSLESDRFCSDINLDINKCYNYYSSKLNIKPGKKYILMAEYHYLKITGETTVPGLFKIYKQGRTIFWTKSQNAYLFRIRIVNMDTKMLFEKSTRNYNINLDSTAFSRGNYLVRIEAIDKNFYDFVNENLDCSGMNDGFGVFGSITIVEKKFKL